MEQKKLCRSMEDKAICGVCSGFAKYFEIDPIIIRLAVVLLALAGTIGIWFYIIAAIVMPKDTDVYYQASAQTAYRYDPETGRPLYTDGTNIYENHAGQRSTPEAFDGAENVYETGETAGTVYETAETAEATEEGVFEQPEQQAQGQYQGQQTQGQYQSQYQAAPQPRTERKVSRGSRNTGILLICIGLVILAKIVFPKINFWIPVAIALIFLGIFLLCRKN